MSTHCSWFIGILGCQHVVIIIVIVIVIIVIITFLLAPGLGTGPWLVLDSMTYTLAECFIYDFTAAAAGNGRCLFTSSFELVFLAAIQILLFHLTYT